MTGASDLTSVTDSRETSTGAVWRLVWTLVVALLIIAVYRNTFTVLLRTWKYNPNYSHGYLIPPIVVYLLWRERKRFAEAVGPGTLWGLALVGLGLAVHVLSIRAGVFMTQGYSLVLLLFGVALVVFGFRATRTIWFPLGYLMFMLPMPPLLISLVGFRLKAFAATLGSRIALSAGIPLVRVGNTIHLPEGSLRIADPCSGLRSLIALVALGALFAYMAKGELWKRLLLFLLAVPIAVFANVVRVAILCTYGHLRGIEAATGFFHDFSGMLVFGIALVGFFLAGRLLRLERGDSL